jgi:hypothetical protein
MRLTTSTIVKEVLNEKGLNEIRFGDTELLCEIYNRCIIRQILKNNLTDKSEISTRIMDRLETSDSFVKDRDSYGRVFVLKRKQSLFGI